MKKFNFKQRGTTLNTEIIAGVTTFFTMAYIVIVNPQILSLTGMNINAVFVATILATVVGTLVMALFADVPYALAPGMGLNAFFTFTVCFALGFAWQEALAMVFICGLINIVITVTKVRKSIIKSIPPFIQNAIGGGIGLFIAFIGIKNAGFLTFTSDPGKNIVLDNGTVIADSSIVPGLITFDNKGALLALIGLIITIILVILKIKGSIFIGIIATTLIGVPMGIVTLDPSTWVSISAIGDIKETAFSLFGSPGFGTLFNEPSKIFLTIITVFAFSLSDTFDTIGTFIGTGRVSGIFDKEDEKALESSNGFKSKMDKALFADATATSIGALFGTSNTTTYVESASGIAVGGRTGFTSIVTAALFLLCLPFSGFFSTVPSQATAPALIIVGIMMAASFKEINWTDLAEAIPSFLIVSFMAFAYNISYGIAAGFIFYCLIKIAQRKFKEVHPIIYGASFLFILNFIILALQNAGII